MMKKKSKIESKKDRIGYKKLKKKIKELRTILAGISNEIHKRKIKKKSTKNEKEILPNLKKCAQQQLMETKS